MAWTINQTDTTANASAIAVHCSGNSNNSDTESNTCTDGGTAGVTERTVTINGNGVDLNAVWMELPTIDEYDGASGDWTVRINVTSGNHQITLDEIHICRLNSSYVSQETLGSNTGIGTNLSGSQVYSTTVNQAASTTITAGDKIVIIFAFDNGNSMTQDIGYTPNSTITAPGSYGSQTQTAFRIRSGDDTALNTDGGWAAAENVSVDTISAEEVFRIRFEFEGVGTLNESLWVSVGGGSYSRVIDFPDDPSAAVLADHVQVVIIKSSQYTDGAATSTSLLTTSSETHVNGVGREGGGGDTDGSGIALATQSTEIEYCILIRGLYDGGFTSDNETFDFRVYDDGAAITAYNNTPRITIDMSYIIGGTYPETWDNNGPWVDSNGNWYVVQEESEPDPNLMMLKSTNEGRTWTIVGDGDANRPIKSGGSAQVDMEGWSGIIVGGDTIHMCHMDSSDHVNYYTFHTSANASNADSWQINETVVELGASAPTEQSTGIVFRTSDNQPLVGYSLNTDEVAIQRRTGTATWATAVDVSGSASVYYGPKMVLGADNSTWIFYHDNTNNDLLVKEYTSGNSLQTVQTVNTVATYNGSPEGRVNIVNPVYYDDGGVEVITVAYLEDTTETLYSNQLRDGTVQTEQQVTSEAVFSNAGLGRMPSAFLVNNGDIVYCIYSDESTRDLQMRSSTDGGTWSSATEIQDGVFIDYVSAAYVTLSDSSEVLACWVDDRPAYNLAGDDSVGQTGYQGGGRFYIHEVVAPPVGGAGFMTTNTGYWGP